MSVFTVARVLQDPCHFTLAADDCFFHDSAVCCLANGHYRYMRWEGVKTTPTDLNLTESQVRIFGSDDQGVNWTLLSEFDVPTHTQWNSGFSPNGTRLLASQFDKADYAYDATYSMLAYSDDGGLTWASAVSPSTFADATFQCQTVGFVKLPSTDTVLAYGQYEFGGIQYNFMRSTDNGQTFTPFSSAGEFIILHATAISDTRLVAYGTLAAYFSDDAGATWQGASKPSFTDALKFAVPMGGSNLLAAGRSSFQGAIFTSSDNGETYTLLASLPLLSNDNKATLRALTPTVLITGGNSSIPGDLQSWWISEDAGVTWTQASAYTGDRVVACDSATMIVTSDGHMLASLDRPTRASAATDNKGEIWRGTVVDLVVEGGTCEVFDVPEPEEPPATAMLRAPLLCRPILTPGPCPQLCPVDPPQPAGLLVNPLGNGGGFRSPLFFLGLAQGGVALGTVALGRPSTCGPTFANNLCAVAGG